MDDRPKIGIATIVKSNELILFGKRKNSHGNGTWSFPGGHLEKYESFIECAKRELEEETGLIYEKDVKYLSNKPIAITNDFFKKENKHYITLFLEAKTISEKFPQVMEPEKMHSWEYFSWKKILNTKKDSLFLPIQNLINQGYKP
jgi:8-oxo-dGTP diphosphatase